MKKSIILFILLLLVFTAGCSASAPAADTEKSSPTFHQISQDEAKEDDGEGRRACRRGCAPPG